MNDKYIICAGWHIHNLGSREVYIEWLETEGPIMCEIHDCDAWLCFSDSIQ